MVCFASFNVSHIIGRLFAIARYFLATLLLMASLVHVSPVRWFAIANHLNGDMYSKEAITSSVAKKYLAIANIFWGYLISAS